MRGIHSGHRDRMRHKYALFGREVFLDHELLEMLLYSSVPYRDTNPVASQLLRAFGGLDGLFRAPAEQLREVCGVGERTAEFLRLCGALSDAMAPGTAQTRPAYRTYQQVGEYFCRLLDGESGDVCVIALFDNGMHLLGTREICRTEFSAANLTALPVVTAAIEAHASAAVMAHTHPHGPLYPTENDRTVNAVLEEALAAVGVRLAEHFIVCGRQYVGYMYHLSEFRHLRQQTELASPALRWLSDGDENPADGGFYADVTALLSCIGSPQRVREAASQLSARYPTAEALSVSDLPALCALPAVGPRFAYPLRLCIDLTSRRGCEGFRFGAPYTDREVARYLSALYFGIPVEVAYLLFVGTRHRITECVRLAEGTVNASHISPRQILECCAARGVHEVILAHNHPGGDPTPSREDIAATAELTRVLADGGVHLAAHYVVAGAVAERVENAAVRVGSSLRLSAEPMTPDKQE